MPHQPGEIYLRPCVFTDGRWLPILDVNPHVDPELGEDKQHVHVDERFLSDDVLSLHKGSPEVSPYPIVRTEDVQFFSYRKVTCYRTHFLRVPGPQNLDLAQLEKACKDLRTGPDLICPHRGAPLHDAPVVSGCLQCPAHGLHWSQATGKLRPVHTEVARKIDVLIENLTALINK